MRILIVGSRNSRKLSSFVTGQMEAICKAGCEVDSFGIVDSGMLGYLKNLPALKRKIKALIEMKGWTREQVVKVISIYNKILNTKKE